MFPLTIRLKKKLNVNVGRSSDVTKIISAELLKLKVDRIRADEARINFSNDLFNKQARWHVMAVIDGGYFDCRSDSTLIYRFSTTRMFLITFIMSCCFATFSWSLRVGISIFLWLYGMNWIICVIRQKILLNRLVSTVDSAMSHGNSQIEEVIANKLYPLQLWLTTLCVATPVLMLMGGLINKDFAIDGRIIFWFALFGIFLSLPVFIICYFTFLLLVTKKIHALIIRVIVAAISVLGIIISLRLVSRSLTFRASIYYCCGVVTSSLFYKIYKHRKRNEIK